MNHPFAARMDNVHRSFIREILKVTENPDVISFAGGLPNPGLFPVQEIARAAAKVLVEHGSTVLQYSTTEGYPPLREYIANRYLQRFGLRVEPDEILITNGSQQGLDLIGKILLDEGDPMIIERPGYLGAIQAFSLYRPLFHAVPLLEDGLDTNLFQATLNQNQIKLFYTVPNFQNPAGVTYSEQKRQEVAQLLEKQQVILVEDDPYGELRFSGQDLPSLACYLKDNPFLLLGTFSKIIAPGLRLGWICTKPAIMDKIIVAKQAADLHSNYLAQRIIYQYLVDNEIEAHIAKIRQAYRSRRDLMVSLIESHFPEEVSYFPAEGGMFLWLTLPKGVSSLDLFDYAARLKVAFVPGQAFYVDGGGYNTLRLNFSNTDEEKITVGIKRLAQATKELLANSL